MYILIQKHIIPFLFPDQNMTVLRSSAIKAARKASLESDRLSNFQSARLIKDPSANHFKFYCVTIDDRLCFNQSSSLLLENQTNQSIHGGQGRRVGRSVHSFPDQLQNPHKRRNVIICSCMLSFLPLWKLRCRCQALLTRTGVAGFSVRKSWCLLLSQLSPTYLS